MELNSERFVGPINSNLICSICFEVLKDPLQDENEHVFCKNCIYKWVEHEDTCPIGREYLRKYKLKPASRLLKNLLGELQVTCDYKSNGCQEIVKLDSLESHLSVCEYRPGRLIQCPNGCEKQLERSQLKDHSCIKELKNDIKELQFMISNINREFDKTMRLYKQINKIDNFTQTNSKFFQYIFILTLIFLFFKYYCTFEWICFMLMIISVYLYVCYKTNTNVMHLLKSLVDSA